MLAGLHRSPSRKRACAHALLVTAFAAVWVWHLTPQANSQEVAKKFGWFFNYLTFFSFSVQLVQFIVCFMADLSPKVPVFCGEPVEAVQKQLATDQQQCDVAAEQTDLNQQ